MSWAYQPDLPQDTPNTWTVCDVFHPDRAGMYRTGYLSASYADYDSGGGFTASTGKAYRTVTGELGIFVSRHTSSGAPTAGHWWVYNGSWNNRIGGATSYISTPEAIAQYGNITLLANGPDAIYSRDATGTSNFAAVASSPDCTILLVTPLNIIVGLNAIRPYSGGDTSASDAWAASDVGDYTNWTTGEAASGNLRQTSGQLTAGVVFGNDVIAFKRRGVYRGQYIGGTIKWKWDLIDASLGAWGPGCAINADGRIYFYGDDGFYSFDGSGFQKLDQGISVTIQNTIGDPVGAFSTENYTSLQIQYDSINRRLYLFNMGAVSAGGAGVRTVESARHFTYNIDSQKWGYQSKLTDNLGAADTFSGVLGNAAELNSFDNGAWNYDTNIAVLSATNTDIRVVTGEIVPTACSASFIPKLRTYRFGKPDRLTSLLRFIPHWTISDGAGTNLTNAVTCNATPYHATSLMTAQSAGTAITLSTDQKRADILKTARYIAVELQVDTEAVINGGTFIAKDGGED
jgi:hypothetical protein